jgi:hypothetical protein
MNGREAIQAAQEATKENLAWYISDFSDTDLLVRPVPGARHVQAMTAALYDCDLD